MPLAVPLQVGMPCLHQACLNCIYAKQQVGHGKLSYDPLHASAFSRYALSSCLEHVSDSAAFLSAEKQGTIS